MIAGSGDGGIVVAQSSTGPRVLTAVLGVLALIAVVIVVVANDDGSTGSRPVAAVPGPGGAGRAVISRSDTGDTSRSTAHTVTAIRGLLAPPPGSRRVFKYGVVTPEPGEQLFVTALSLRRVYDYYRPRLRELGLDPPATPSGGGTTTDGTGRVVGFFQPGSIASDATYISFSVSAEANYLGIRPGSVFIQVKVATS